MDGGSDSWPDPAVVVNIDIVRLIVMCKDELLSAVCAK
jgi:hypothetical protein